MRVLHVSWEYPPLVYGGLARHVQGLAEAQARAGHDVTVLTQQVAGAAAEDRAGGVRIRRVPPDPPEISQDDLLAWVLALGHALARVRCGPTTAGSVESAVPEVVHVHDWVVAHAGVALRDAYGVPLVATIHATEAGRHQGWLPDARSRAIHTTERWLVHEAQHVLTCSAHMAWEVDRLFDVPDDRLTVVPNGIDLRRWRAGRNPSAASRAAHAGSGPLLVCVARLEHEKGLQTLLHAMPRLRRRFPGIRLVVAGRGGYEPELRELARAIRLGRTVGFAGWLAGSALRSLVAAADLAVVPSRYEPSGLAAMEAIALGTPVVVAAVGGLAELVRDGRGGLAFPPGDAGALADAVTTMLRDEVLARRAVRTGRAALRSEHDWGQIALQIDAVYEQALHDFHVHPDGGTRAPQAPPVPAGNLLT